MNHELRIIQLLHATPGRTRLRLGWLRGSPQDAEPLAEHLATLDASMEVRVRPWTGSVLCTYDAEALDETAIVSAVRRHTGVAIVLRPGEVHPEVDAAERAALRRAAHEHGTTRRAVTSAFRELNHDLVRATGGRLDLGSLTGLGFLALGAAEILSAREVPAPPWFQLAWWAYRTFTISGGASEEAEEATGPEGNALEPADA